jgi:uncharacterized protein YjiS (DUF1127 family)
MDMERVVTNGNQLAMPARRRTAGRFPGLARVIRRLRERRANRLRRRHLDVVPADILKDIGMTRPQVFAGIPGRLSAARP